MWCECSDLSSVQQSASAVQWCSAGRAVCLSGCCLAAGWLDAAVVGFARTEQSVSATLPPPRCDNARKVLCCTQRALSLLTVEGISCCRAVLCCCGVQSLHHITKTKTDTLLCRPPTLRDALLWRWDVWRGQPGGWETSEISVLMQPAVMTGPGRGPGLQNYHPRGEEVLPGREGEPAREVHQDRRDVGRRKKGKKPMDYFRFQNYYQSWTNIEPTLV